MDETNKKKLRTLLEVIRIKCQDLSFDAQEVFDLLLQSRSPDAGNYFVNVNTLTKILQVDFMVNVTESDQHLLMGKYGDNFGNVDVHRLLVDMDLWPETAKIQGSRDTKSVRKSLELPEEISSVAKRSERDHTEQFPFIHQPTGLTVVPPPRINHPVSAIGSDLDGPSIAREMEFGSVGDDRKRVDRLQTTRAFDLFGDLVQRTNRSIDSLADIHTAITSSKPLPSRSRTINSADALGDGELPTETKKFTIKVPETGNSRVSGGPNTLTWDHQPSLIKTTDAAFSEPAFLREPSKDKELARIAALTHENEMLKKEMRVFDAEFFEELEDLKYRYARLQDVVGEFPKPKPSSAVTRIHASPERDPTASSNTGSEAVSSGSPLPLSRLGITARKSMTAVDKASLHSQLLDTRPNYLGIRREDEYPHSFPESNMISTRRREQDFRPFPFTHPGRTSPNDFTGDRDRRSNSGYRDNMLERDHHRRSYLESDRSPERGTSRNMSGDFRFSGTMSYRDLDNFLVSSGEAIKTSRFDKKDIVEAPAAASSNIYERRLMFELSQLASPTEATNTLIHRVVDQAGYNGTGFVTVPQLMTILNALGIRMTSREIEILCAGFASNGQGGINAKEFCDALQAMLYHILGEHALREESYRQEAMNAKLAMQTEDDVDNILLTISEGILLKEKKNTYGVAQPLDRTAKGLFKHIVTPFLVVDESDTGIVSFDAFCECVAKLGATLDMPDLLLVAKRYRAKGIQSDPSRREGEGNRSDQGHLTQSFNKWMATAGIPVDSPYVAVEYTPIVKRLVSMLTALFESTEPDEMLHLKLPWIMREFALVDKLLNQLESMKTGDRRRSLMALQYSLAAADVRTEGSVDGFSVLDSLVKSGFKLQRLDRIQLLRSIEEMGGRLEYEDLCQVLLRSCADWTEEERAVVSKILQSMGITVFERRSWLAKLRYELSIANASQNRKLHAWGRTKSGPLSTIGLTDAMEGVDDVEPSGSDPGISPSAFLRCLRNCGVSLKVEEEALLLDCLDTERLAEMGNLAPKAINATTKGSTLLPGNWSVPLIYYKSFLSFCSRHCGHWSDISPALTVELHEAVRLIYNPMDALHELSELLRTLDEENSGRLSIRAFQVACHRSRLLSSLSQADTVKLSEILAADGHGKVEYASFLVFLRASCKRMQSKTSAAPGIISQLLQNCTDSGETLLPLRNWLIRNTDSEHGRMAHKELVNLLREFSVVYRSEDLNDLLNDVKLTTTDDGAKESDSFKKSGLGLTSTLSYGRETIDTRNFLSYVLQARGKWTKIHPRLCEKISKLLKMCGLEKFTPNRQNNSSSVLQTVDEQHMSFAKTPKGIETAAARLLMSRLRSFSDISPINNNEFKVAEMAKIAGDDEVTGTVVSFRTECRMIERDIFAHVCRSSGLPLSDEDIMVLADSTDVDPAAQRVRCDCIVEALRDSNLSGRNEIDREEVEIDGIVFDSARTTIRGLTEEGIFALKHLRDLLWTTAGHLGRSTVEWKADVAAIFSGFDQGGVGFISSEDFSVALSLLRAPITWDILRDIPCVPDGPGLIAYKDILEIVLQPPQIISKSPHDYGDQETDPSRHGLKSGSKKDVSKPDRNETQILVTPVNALLRVMRKSIRKFVVSVDDLEEAWMYMLRAFKQYDNEETNVVHPRDFCLAIAVLVEDDDLVLTKSDWTSIMNHFSADPARREKARDDKLRGEAAQQLSNVDYIEFCEAVLNPIELTKSFKSGDLEKAALVKSTTVGKKKAYAPQRGNSQLSRSSRNEEGEIDDETSPALVTKGYSFTRNRKEIPSRVVIAEVTQTRRTDSFGTKGKTTLSTTRESHNGLSQGQRSRMASSIRSSNISRENLGSSSSTYVTTAAGKKIRGSQSRSKVAGDYYSAWKRGEHDEPEDDLHIEVIELDQDELIDENGKHRSGGGNTNGLHMKYPDSTEIDDEAMKSAWREGRRKVQKFYKGSSSRVQNALRGVSMSVNLQDAIVDLQNQIYAAIEYLLSSGQQHRSVYDILEGRLREEDRNKSNTLAVQSLYAALGSLGLPHTRIFSSSSQKKIIQLLEGLSGEKNKILLGDFLALIFDSI